MVAIKASSHLSWLFLKVTMQTVSQQWVNHMWTETVKQDKRCNKKTGGTSTGVTI